MRGVPVVAQAQQQAVPVGKADVVLREQAGHCLLYTSDAADERSSVDLGGRRIIKKKHNNLHTSPNVALRRQQKNTLH